MTIYVYLHGFASSPASAKAQYFEQRFRELDLPLLIPDLNQPNFYDLSLSRQIQQVKALLAEFANQPVTMIGSSFGGLTAAWLAEEILQVQQLVLLAPAFQFWRHWQPRLGEQLQRWQIDRSLLVYHYGAEQMRPLGYGFVTDLAHYDETNLRRCVPTLILHGRQDDVIPIQSSRDYGSTRPWVRLIEMESDHALTNVQSEIWQMTCQFCRLGVEPIRLS